VLWPKIAMTIDDATPVNSLTKPFPVTDNKPPEIADEARGGVA
jgi:hypothetical protein